MAKVKWRGQTFDERTRDMLEELAKISGPIYIHPTQGSYRSNVAASAGTHAGGGAVDLMHHTWSKEDYDTVVRLGRQIGFAMWHRTPEQSNWPRHVHGIAMGCEDASDGAKAQMLAYKAGRNGLANGGPDDGPRKWVGQTWETYKAGGVVLPDNGSEDDMAISKDDANLIAARIWRADVVASPHGKDSDNPTWTAGTYMRKFLTLMQEQNERLERIEAALLGVEPSGTPPEE